MNPPTRAAFLVATWLHDDQTFNRLSSPSRDVDKLAAVLGDPMVGQFEVETLHNPTLQELKLRLAAFLKDRGREDTGLVYFSGHGVLDEASQEYHIATKDTLYQAVSATALERDWLVKQMGLCRSKRLVLLLDTCHSGAFAGRLGLKGVDTRTVGAHFEGSGRAVIAAAGPLEYARDGSDSPESTSIFTAALLRGLESGAADTDKNTYVTVQELYEYICEEVRGQRPVLSGTFDGHIWLSQVPLDQRPIAELPSYLCNALGSASVFERLGAVSELDELLSGDDLALRRAAEVSLSMLLDDDSFKVRSAAEKVLRTHGTVAGVAPDVEDRRVDVDNGDPADVPDEPVGLKPSATGASRMDEVDGGTATGLYAAASHVGQWVQSMDVHPDGYRVAVGIRNGLALLSLESGELLAKVRIASYANRTRDVRFSPDGRRLVAVSDDGAWYLFDTEGLNQRRKKHTRWFGKPGALTLHSVRFLPGGQEFAVACGDGMVRVYTTEGAQHREFHSGEGDPALAMDVTSSGHCLAVGHKSGTVVTWDVPTFGRRAVYKLEGEVLSVAFAPSADPVAAGTSEGLFVIDVSEDPTVVRRVERHGPIRSVAWNVSGEFLTLAAPHRVTVLSTDGWKAVASIDCSAPVKSVRILPSEVGLHVAIGGDEKQVRVVSL